MRGNGDKYKKVLSLDNEEVYTLPVGIASAIEYDPKYLLDEDEWFFIANFSAQNYSIDIRLV